MEFLEDANDARLKPRLLLSLVRDRLPDEKRCLPSPSQLSSILSLVRTHDLLSESLPPWTAAAMGPDKLAAAWGAAVDAWVDRCLALSSSKTPDKRWAGVCLLGATCEMCSEDRFLRSYPIWFQTLLSNIQLPPGDSHLVKLVSCASMSDLLTRLANFANIKKDATSLASKLSLPLLQLLSDDGDAMLVGALDLLGTLLRLFPFSVHRHYEKVETMVISKIMSEKYSADASEKLAYCLALLTKVKADEDNWITMMHKVLMSINMYLTNAFRGLEEETRSTEFMRLVAPPGKDPPSPLGGLAVSSVGPEQARRGVWEVQVSRLCRLMQCCCTMITTSDYVQVTLPVQLLISQIERVLSVDGSLHETYTSFTSELHQELICSELPSLHLSSLDLLTAVIKTFRSQLCSDAVSVTRILTEYFKRATLPCLRKKVYSIMQILLTSMGIGMVPYLAEEVINNAVADLNPLSSESRLGSSNSKVQGECTVHHSSRKRKHVSGVLEEQIGADLGKETVTRKPTTPLSVQIAALHTLEALVTVAGSLKAECWRPDVDRLLMTVAENACYVGLANEKKSNIPEWGSSSSRADFQLAALQTLLASFLSHGYSKPPYLSQGLQLFRRGTKEIGTKIAVFCTHAMLALAVLHSWSFSLTESPVTKSSGFSEIPSHPSYRMFPCGRKLNLLASSGDTDHAVNDLGLIGDDVYNSWLDNGEKNAVGETNADAHIEDVDSSDKPVEKPSPEMVRVVTSVNPHLATEGSCVPNCDADMDENADKLMDNGEQGFKDTVNVSVTCKTLPRQGVSTSDMSSDGIVPGVHHDEGKTDVHKDVKAQDSLPSRTKMMSYDSDSPSLDSLPDIVDADPDSD